ncbi:hypothetical protein [Phormidium tenue]|uniref:Uncharacterized protein n=1 Tax=Phormidium tenue NIES-30 TaxID=549789 RepID=A0A1U7J9P4_9CYAN|nr:hypothetical protein [Phormidium tenue]MBD2230770.1 hypothetical protein [Phormidium tenue FACHB-1052]OKH50175.1 hypothetical protein NIES30_05640 [Phormidium tenue NIES-30]
MAPLPLQTKTLIALLALGTIAIQGMAAACIDPSSGAGGFPEQSEPRPALEPNPEPRPGNWEVVTVEDLLTRAVSRRILRAVAAEVNRPASALRIAAAEPATWDGCMGIYEPDQFCTMIAISGLRLVVTDGDQSWVYHARQDGRELVQNPTAISRNGLIPDFIPPVMSEPEAEPEAHIFRSVESGSLIGTQFETVLLTDGRLLRKENDKVVSERQLSAAQVAAFEQVLADQRFPNLNRLRYITDAAFADYPTVQLSASHYETTYIDLAIDDAPPALQAVVQAWSDLTTEAQ